MHIRFATETDASLIHRFISDLAIYEREPEAVECTPESLAAQLRQSHPPFECLIAEAAGEPLGFALFFHNYSTWTGRRGLYLEDLWVTPNARRQGVARALFQRLAAIAVERDCARFDWAVLNWNELALAFYREIGAEPQDTWTSFRISGEALLSMAGRSRG